MVKKTYSNLLSLCRTTGASKIRNLPVNIYFHLTENILNGQFSGNFSGQFFYDFLAFYSMPRIFTRCTLLIQQDLNLKSFQQFWANQYMKNYHALFTSELWMLWQGEKSNWHTCDNNKRWIQKRTSFLEPSYISS